MKANTWHLLLAACVLLVLQTGLVAAAVVKDLEFSAEGVLPSADEDVEFFNSTGQPEETLYTVSGGLLHQRTLAVDGNASYFYPRIDLTGGAFDPSQTVTVEARLRVTAITTGQSNTAGGAYFQVFDGANNYGVFFRPEGVELLDGPTGRVILDGLDIASFHTYTLVSPGESTEYTLLIDGEAVFTGEAPQTVLNGFDFGDGFSDVGAGADADWDYIRAEQDAVDPTLAAYWAFDEGTGNTAGDGSGNGHNGTISGAAWTPGVSGIALQFDGDDFVDINTAMVLPTNPSAFTIAAWIRTTHEHGTVFVQTTPGFTGSDVNHCLVAAHFDEYPPTGGGSPFIAPILDDQWHHVAVVVEGGMRQLYVDGTPDGDDPQEIYAGATPDHVRIGDRNGWMPELYGFVGAIDEVRAYERALSPDDVRNLFLGIDCLTPSPLPDCRAVSSGLLFGARWTTDASGIPPGGPYIFDQTTVTLTKEPGDHFWLSGGLDSTSSWISGDRIYVNGTSAGLGFSGILDPGLPLCRPIEEVLAPAEAREITDLIPDGTNCVEFKLADTNRGVYGNSPLYLYKYREPYALISATTDRTLYQNGVEIVHMTLVTRSNWGQSDQVRLSVDLEPSLGEVMHAGDDYFTLAPGEQHVTNLQWAVPDSSYPWEFHGTFRLGAEGFGATLRVRGWFRGNAVDPVVVQEHQQQVLDCWTPEEECRARFGAMIPVAGTGFSLALATNDFCKAAQFRNAGDRGRADGAFRAGQDKLGKQLILESITMLAIGTPIGTPVLIAKFLHSTGEYARHCMNGTLADMLSWLPLNGRSATTSGSAVDSLATWVAAGIDSTAADLADIFLLAGRADVRIEAAGGYAVLDSTGLVYGHVDVVDTIAVIASTTRHVYELHGSETDNPHSAATFHAWSLAAQTVTVGVLHAAQDGLRHYLRYPGFPVQAGVHIWVELADDLEGFPLMVDDNGDDVPDRVFTPIPAGVDEPGSTAKTILRWNYPNPSPATTRIRFSVRETGRTSLRIYDASGRFVTTLFDRETGLGEYEVVWNGRTERGSEAANGAYFYQLRTKSATLARRLILLR